MHWLRTAAVAAVAVMAVAAAAAVAVMVDPSGARRCAC
jgi:hypothetical protein